MAALRVELIYDPDCPNIHQARTQLLKAFGQAGIAPNWIEWNRQDPDSPSHARQYGSPTILVHGKDVAGVSPAVREDSCRLYAQEEGGSSGVPPVRQIVRRLIESSKRSHRKSRAGYLGSAALGPSFLTAFLAKAACPFCYPALAGLFTSIGLGFLLEGPYLAAATIGLVALALFGLGFRATERRGYSPLVLGASSAAVLCVGKLGMDSDFALYVGAAGLVAASLWNLIPKRGYETGPCNGCAPAGVPQTGA